MKVMGLVLARSGSKGLPGKNMLKLRGRTLLERAIHSALESRHISRVLLSTDDDAYAEHGRAAGAEVPFRRPAELATDTASSWDVVRHAVGWLEREENWNPEIVVLLQPTTPFRRGAHIDQAVEAIIAGQGSAMTIREVDYPPQWMLLQKADGRLERLLAGRPTPKRRQDAIKVYQPNGMVYAFRRALLDRESPCPGPETVGIQVGLEESINIDELWQFDLSRAIADRLEPE